MSESQEVAARERARIYLDVLATGTTKSEAARRAGVRVDHLPYWRKKHDGFKRREQLVVEGLQAQQDLDRLVLCPCGEVVIGIKGQEFCSRSCAQSEVQSAYWGVRDTKVLEALSEPLSRRDLSVATGITINGLRSTLRRLHRRGLIKREGAPRGHYCKWLAA